jgi:hypothetical protein
MYAAVAPHPAELLCHPCARVTTPARGPQGQSLASLPLVTWRSSRVSTHVRELALHALAFDDSMAMTSDAWLHGDL